MSQVPALVPVASVEAGAASHDALVVVAPAPLSKTAAELGLPAPVRAALDEALAPRRRGRRGGAGRGGGGGGGGAR